MYYLSTNSVLPKPINWNIVQLVQLRIQLFILVLISLIRLKFVLIKIIGPIGNSVLNISWVGGPSEMF